MGEFQRVTSLVGHAPPAATCETWPRGRAGHTHPTAGFRCRTILGDYRPLPTTPFRCEGCGAGAYRPLQPEEVVLCDPCLQGDAA